MGFFKRSVPSEKTRTALTIIAKNNKISGDLIITGKIHIDGYVEGNITSIEDITIGKTGLVQGVIKAQHVTVSGVVEGEVYCQHLHIASGGKVVAKVESAEMTMDSKSHFTGQCKEVADSHLNGDEIKARHIDLAKASNHSLSNQEIDLDSLSDKKSSVQNADVIDNLPDKITLSSTDTDFLKPTTSRFKPLGKQRRVDRAENLDKAEDLDSASFDNQLDALKTASKVVNHDERDQVIASQESTELGLQQKKQLLDAKNSEVETVAGATIVQNQMKTATHAKKVVAKTSASKPEKGNNKLQAPLNGVQEKIFSKPVPDESVKVRVNDLKDTAKTIEQVKSKIVDENTTKLELKF